MTASSAVTAAPTANPPLHFVGGALWSLGGRAIAMLTGTATSMLLARLLAPEDLGAWFLWFTLVSFAALLGQLGLGGVLVRLVSEALATGRDGRARQVAYTGLRLGGVGALLVAAALLALAPWLLADTPHLCVWLAAPWLIVLALQNLLTETFRGFQDLRRATLTGSITGGVVLVMILLAAFAFGIGLQLHHVLAAQLAAATMAVLLAAIPMRTRLRRLPRTAGIAVRELLPLAMPFLGTGLVFFALAQADLWIVGCCRPKADVALYGAAWRLAALANMPLFVVNAVLPPIIASLHATGRRAQLQAVLRAAAALAFAPTLLAVAAFLFAGGPVLALVFGAYYRDAAPILLVLALGQLVNTFAGSCGLTLMMTGQQRPMLLLTAGVGAATIAAAAAVAPAAGPLGVAMVMLGSQLAQNAGMWWLARRRLGLSTHADVFARMSECWRILRQAR